MKTLPARFKTHHEIMKKRLTHVAPLQLGIVLGALYGIVSLIFVPFILLAALFGRGFHLGGILLIFLPILYAIGGFIGGVISAAVYNLIAKWTGGVEFTTTEVSPAI
jgi:hypothetical protein